MDKVFKALSDPNRRKILDLLKEKDMSVNEILKHFNIRQASLSHHLDILKRAELVTDTKRGQYVYYSLNMTVFEELINWFYQFMKKDK